MGMWVTHIGELELMMMRLLVCRGYVQSKNKEMFMQRLCLSVRL